MTFNYKENIAAVIPALNEENTIAEVVNSVKLFCLPIVIDDGSHDKTAEIAKKNGSIVIKRIKNGGYETALEAGFNCASNLGFDYLITLDADGQHDPAVISQYYDLLVKGYELVVGRRDRMQRIGERVFSFAARLIWGIQDPLCGMKAYNIKKLLSLSAETKDYDSVGTKYALRLIAGGCKFYEVEIKTRQRKDSPRFGGGYKANKKIIISLLKGIYYYGKKNPRN